MSEPTHVAGQLDLDGRPVPPAAVARPNPERVTIDVELSVTLTAAECWGGPDGIPDRWDARTLADELAARYAGDLPGLLTDWNLADHASVAITAGGLTSYPRGLT